MSKGLVKVKLALPDVSKILPDGLGYKPINKQAAKLLFKSDWIYKPMPSDPDLEDRKVVQLYLKEREYFMKTISTLKAARRALMEESNRLHGQIRDLKKQINEAKESGKITVTPPKDDLTLLKTKVTSMSIPLLQESITELKAFLASYVDSKGFSIRAAVVLQDLVNAMQQELKSRQ